MSHAELAERAASRLEAMADRLEEEGGWLKLDTVSSRAKELRVAAHQVRDKAVAVTQEEDARGSKNSGPQSKISGQEVRT